MNLYFFTQFDTSLNKDIFLSKDWDAAEKAKDAYKTMSLADAVDTLRDIGLGWTIIEADEIPDHRWQ